MTLRVALQSVLLFVVSLLPLSAQIKLQRGNASEFRSTHTLPASAQVLQIPATIVQDLASARTVSVTVPSPSGDIVLRLEQFALFTKSAVMTVQTANGEQVADVPEHTTLRGTIAGAARSTVFMAAFTTHIVALIERTGPDGPERWMISPDTIIPGRMANHVYYKLAATSEPPGQCHAEELPNYQLRVDSIMNTLRNDLREKNRGQELPQARVHALQLALDCTHSFYKNLGSELGTAAASAIAIAGACAVVYRRDADVEVLVPYLRIWTVADPYPGSIGDKLGAIRTHWDENMKHVQRSVTCLLSGEGGGGLAWVGVLCSPWGYNVSGVDGRVSFPADGYVWDVDVTSHELGHNIGSSHTHSCSWAPPIDSCWDAEGGCYQWRRVQRGTIMSYCHLQWKGTELAFHPRVASLFNRVLSQVPCAAPVPNPSDTDVAVVAIEIPTNGGVVQSGTPFTPRVYVRNVGAVGVRDVSVRVRITDLANATLVDRTYTIATISAGQTIRSNAPTVTPLAPGDYLIEVTASVADDVHPTNNMMTRPLRFGSRSNSQITVVSPNGGEVLRAGTSAEIRFTATNVQRAAVDVSTDGGATWATARAIHEGASPVAWKVPYTPSPNCFVRVSRLDDPSAFDVSDAPFRIVSDYDAAAIDLEMPVPNSTVATPFTPVGVIRNEGADTLRNVLVELELRWVRSTTPSYTQPLMISVLAPGATARVPFGSTPVLASGVHVATLTVTSEADSNTANNVFAREFTATGIAPPYGVRWEQGPRRIILQWSVDGSQDADRIEIHRSVGGAEPVVVSTVRPSVTTYVDTDVLDGDTVWYSLRLRRGAAVSPLTTPLVCVAKGYPLGGDRMRSVNVISPFDGAANVSVPVDFVWDRVEGANQYEIQVSRDATFRDLEYNVIVRDDDATMMPIEFGARRWWRVRALNQSTTGGWSSPHGFTSTRSCAGSALTFANDAHRASDETLTWDGGAVTVEYWTFVSRADLRASTTFMVGEADNSNNRFQVHAPWDDGVVYWDYGNLNDGGRLTASFAPYFDQWVHLAFVCDGSSYRAIYINGKEVARDNRGSAPTDLRMLTIGGMRGYLPFKGMIDEFRLWKVARTADEVRDMMSRRLPPTADNSKIVGVWRFEEGSGTEARDAVRNRVLSLSENTMWTTSGANVGCDEIGSMAAPAFVGIQRPFPRDHRNVVQWSPIRLQNRPVWYDVRVEDTASNSAIYERTNVFMVNGSQNVALSLNGLPADTTFRLRVRARSTGAKSDWITTLITTPPSCPSASVRFSGNGERLTAADVLFRGRAATVEFWSYVATEDVKGATSFMLGSAATEDKRMQAHAPWDNKTLYWDYGDHRESGRLEHTYENMLDRWVHVALTSNGHDTMCIYYNGRLVKRSSFSSTPGDLDQLVIGGDPYARVFHRGALAGLRVWNVMRSERQIQHSMYEGITSQRDHLVGTWPMDEGEGLRAYETSFRSGPASSSTEVTWWDPVAHAMHAPAVVWGPRLVTTMYGEPDTSLYVIRKTRDAVHSITSIEGGYRLDDRGDTVVIVWDKTGRGTITIQRSWVTGCVDTTYVDVMLSPALNVREDDPALASVSVWPNPANEVLWVNVPVTLGAADASLIDVTGRVVSRWTQQGTSSYPLREVASGAYTVVLRWGAVQVSRGLVVKR